MVLQKKKSILCYEELISNIGEKIIRKKINSEDILKIMLKTRKTSIKHDLNNKFIFYINLENWFKIKKNITIDATINNR
ncbi:hypothetical protein BpHYR1_046976 [Brachionus plicatilis]|uniref:Uncharacterized protein n=1 Tax=Brachionus plicatilis TaxID=10195 RepID=A0A3M7SE30_BRAPC|nr:hypothetical protein BpHYR1_046976 [Brachionus plicatilis]